MRKMMLVTLVAATVGLAGCKKKPRNDMVAAPGPMPVEPAPAPAPEYTPPPAPAPVPVAPEPAAVGTPTGGRTYVVQRGDTLYGIARKAYGDQTKVKAIIAANPGIDPNHIKAGQTLTLP